MATVQQIQNFQIRLQDWIQRQAQLIPWPHPQHQQPQFEYKKHISLESRRQHCAGLRAKHPDRIPVIVEKAARSQMPTLEQQRFVVREELTAAQFVYHLRKTLPLHPAQTMLLLVNNSIPPMPATMGQLYETHRDPEDGLLYIRYSGENTFGSTGSDSVIAALLRFLSK